MQAQIWNEGPDHEMKDRPNKIGYLLHQGIHTLGVRLQKKTNLNTYHSTVVTSIYDTGSTINLSKSIFTFF